MSLCLLFVTTALVLKLCVINFNFVHLSKNVKKIRYCKTDGRLESYLLFSGCGGVY